MTKFTLKGLHQVRKLNADGSTTWHLYAWRGGPKLATSPHRVNVADDALITAYQEAHARPLSPTGVATTKTLASLIDEWRASAEFQSLRPGSRKDYDDQVKKILAGEARDALNTRTIRLVDLTLRNLEDRRVRGVFLAWRDANFSSTPRTADKVIGTLSACLSWGVDRGKLTCNPLLGSAKLHRTNRSESIWTEDDLAKLAPHCSADMWRAVQMALLTGLALADLVRVPWSSYDGSAVEGRREKTGRPFLIPALPALKALLDEAPQRSPIILTNSYGQPWSKSGLSHGFGAARDKAGLRGRLVFHDLRGTAATHFIASGLTYAQAGAILGWDEKRVEAIARRYVDRKTVISAMMDRLAPSGTTSGS